VAPRRIVVEDDGVIREFAQVGFDEGVDFRECGIRHGECGGVLPFKGVLRG